MMPDDGPSDDRNIVSEHVKNFVKTGARRSSDELAGSLGLAGFAARGIAGGVGGLALGLAADVLSPTAQKLGRELAGEED
jgi:hypothetical protein